MKWVVGGSVVVGGWCLRKQAVSPVKNNGGGFGRTTLNGIDSFSFRSEFTAIVITVVGSWGDPAEDVQLFFVVSVARRVRALFDANVWLAILRLVTLWEGRGSEEEEGMLDARRMYFCSNSCGVAVVGIEGERS